MVDLTFRDFKDDVDSGVPDMLSRVADVARQAACNIYQKSPGAWLAKNVPGTPLLDTHRVLMDTLCDGVVPPPPPPPPPFTGGQCACQNYSVRATFRDIDFPNRINQITTPGIAGAIGNVITVRPVPGITPTAYALFIDYSIGCGATKSWQLSARDTRPNYFTSWEITEVVTVPLGQPDLCGNPPGVYPPGNLTANDFDFTTTIEFSPGVDVDVDVSVVPTLTFNGPVVGGVNLSAELNVNVGGINVSASLGGFTFSPTINFNGGTSVPTIDPRPSPPPAKAPTPPPSTFNPEPDLDDIKRRIDDIQEEMENCCDAEKPFPEPDPEKVATQVIATGRSGVGSIPSGTYKVTLEITARPTQEKIQFGLQASDVLYAGWSWFETQGAMQERTTVDAVEKAYAPPARGGDKFHYTLYEGYSAIIRAYYIL